jgi:hypothetical protein
MLVAHGAPGAWDVGIAGTVACAGLSAMGRGYGECLQLLSNCDNCHYNLTHLICQPHQCPNEWHIGGLPRWAFHGAAAASILRQHLCNISNESEGT